MEYLVFFLALLFLIGSVSLAIPSKKSQKISKLRMEARKLGANITSALYGSNDFKNYKKDEVYYQIKNKSELKEAHYVRDKGKLLLYSPVKFKYSDRFVNINLQIEKVSESINEIIFTEKNIKFIWNEIDEISELKLIIDKLNQIK
ncbi:MAG: hypothetical protein CMD79_04330 [Gammaproteobacteria bacterium]|nr:hypothetical protein [Gammaproteobacteria bacterium]